jgi:hypothetical protein
MLKTAEALFALYSSIAVILEPLIRLTITWPHSNVLGLSIIVSAQVGNKHVSCFSCFLHPYLIPMEIKELRPLAYARPHL